MRLLLAALLAVFGVLCVIAAITSAFHHDPSMAELRQQGYTSCHAWRNNLGSLPDAKCIYDHHLVEFQDSPFYVDLPAGYGG